MFIENFDIQKMKKYRHTIACLIDVSIGYFTPASALRAIEAYKNNKTYFCEWYMDMADKRRRYNHDNSDEKTLYLTINKDIIKDAMRYRRATSHKSCLAIVDRNIAGNYSIGASWF